MARVTGPLFSMDASGQVGKAIVFAKWKGRAYVREYVIPENPDLPKQHNVRLAFILMVELWQDQDAPSKLEWETYAKPFAMSGFNAFMGRGMQFYKPQLTTSVVPISVDFVGAPPDDEWTWSAT